jgi:hypothetical protein
VGLSEIPCTSSSWTQRRLGTVIAGSGAQEVTMASSDGGISIDVKLPASSDADTVLDRQGNVLGYRSSQGSEEQGPAGGTAPPANRHDRTRPQDVDGPVKFNGAPNRRTEPGQQFTVLWERMPYARMPWSHHVGPHQCFNPWCARANEAIGDITAYHPERPAEVELGVFAIWGILWVAGIVVWLLRTRIWRHLKSSR